MDTQTPQALGQKLEDDVMAHFAQRGDKVGSAFDRKGFWIWASVKYPISPAQVTDALEALVSKGFVLARVTGYRLTADGALHLPDKQDAAAAACAPERTTRPARAARNPYPRSA